MLGLESVAHGGVDVLVAWVSLDVYVFSKQAAMPCHAMP